MSEAVADPSVPRAPRRRWRLLGAAGLALAVGLGGVWLARERLVDGVLAGQLRDLGLEASYRIESVGPTRQVLRDVVIGDPRHPDLTIDRAEIALSPRWGLPEIGAVRLDRPRLYGTWTGDRLSFGRLDPLLARRDGAPPFRLPRLTLTIRDGRARLLGDHGPVGLAFDGSGPLRDGFAGTLAAVAPRLAAGGCALSRASLYGRVRITGERPAFAGPLRLGAARCTGPGRATLDDVTVDLALQADRALAGGSARLGLATGATALAGVRAQGWAGTIEATWRHAVLAARYDLAARAIDHAAAGAATLRLTGGLRAPDGPRRIDAEGSLAAEGLHPGADLIRQLDRIAQAATGTLVAPLLRQARAALAREAPGSRLRGDYRLRRSRDGIALVVPQARLTGTGGATLLALSRLQLGQGDGPLRLAGNVITGGPGLPRITGRLDESARGRTRLRLAMADYRAGDARIAVPRLTLEQDRTGALAFTGLLTASGALPGGRVDGLQLPLDGARDVRGRLALGRRCLPVTFAALTLSDLTLDGPGLTLCPTAAPAAGRAIVQGDARGLRIAVSSPGLRLHGRLGETPLRIASGALGYAAPGGFTARALDVTLGPPEAASRFRVTSLSAAPGPGLAGRFAGAEVRLAAVPLNLRDASGAWRLRDGRLEIGEGAFRLEDRLPVPRFQPLLGREAGLALENNSIRANAILNEPESGREIARLTLSHDLGRGQGQAAFTVPGLVFDAALQPHQLSRQLLGVVANVRGQVTGEGRIDWSGDRLRSRGRFGTEGLDLAAAFGPAQGIRGEVAFSDLLGLVTPPHQRVTIASLNPGIEVTGGELTFQLQPDSIVAIERAHWPFLGGTIALRPVALRFGVAETRRFVIDIAGLDAAHFLERMELANLSATGTFDGALPLVFDENGGRIEGGLLIARPPGGNIAYVGALTYKDLTPFANFAFAALKSLDYRTMRIAMDGALDGEMVTRVRFDGVRQGAGARRNLLTRQLARVPLQFNLNLRAPFYRLITSVKGLYDPSYQPDPRSLGLIDARGRPVPRPGPGLAAPPATPPPTVPPPGAIQPPVSEKRP